MNRLMLGHLGYLHTVPDYIHVVLASYNNYRF